MHSKQWSVYEIKNNKLCKKKTAKRATLKITSSMLPRSSQIQGMWPLVIPIFLFIYSWKPSNVLWKKNCAAASCWFQVSNLLTRVFQCSLMSFESRGSPKTFELVLRIYFCGSCPSVRHIHPFFSLKKKKKKEERESEHCSPKLTRGTVNTVQSSHCP